MNRKLLLVVLSSLLLAYCGTEQAKQPAQPENQSQQQQQPAQPAPAPTTPAPETPPVAASPAPSAPQEDFFGNKPPRLKGAKFLSAKGGGFHLEVETEDPEKDPVKLSYSWKVNDVVVSDADTIGPVKRGDRVEVT